ncbi:hypothetical protein KIW84_075075 [Lathyrus oleraceus]|uniref:Uncharacterized protein n=1 Tax=Pisum sativum TaxID=3888 RepID=A0A9D4VT14_PEA|nr:hypothetical protein KIW84_075075 [Pisum sativum]
MLLLDVAPLSMVHGHATPIRKSKTSSLRKGKLSKVSTSSSPSMAASNEKILEASTDIKKPHSMTSLYLEPINIEPNVDASAKCPIVENIMENVETYENTSKPRSVTTLSKSSMIVPDRDDVDTNICMLVSQVLGIEPKTGVVTDVSTSWAQPDNTTKTPLDKSDVNMSTQSPEKLEDKEDYDGMSSDLADKEANFVGKKDQSTDIVNIYDLDSDDKPIDIVMTSGQKPSRSTTRAGILVDLKDTCKTLDETIKICTKRKSNLEILIKALSEEEGNLKDDETGEEDANEEGDDASDDEQTTSSDED